MGDNAAVLREMKLENGQKLVLRKPVPDDAEDMIEYLNQVGGESDNLLFGEGEFPLTVEQEREYLGNVASGDGFFVIALIADALVGVAHLSCPARKRVRHNAELSISVRKAHWGKGIGKAMMEEMLQYAKNHKGIRNIHLGVKASNINAIRMYEKFGFDKIGVYKDYFNVNGTYDDEILMELDTSETE